MSSKTCNVLFIAAVTIKRRLDLMLALPLASLDSLAIQRQVKDIGKT